jgi:hypothetical protein
LFGTEQPFAFDPVDACSGIKLLAGNVIDAFASTADVTLHIAARGDIAELITDRATTPAPISPTASQGPDNFGKDKAVRLALSFN